MHARWPRSAESSPPSANRAEPPESMTRRALLAALIVGLAAFALYKSTLLPGVDFGDTGSFQATVGSPLITPRDGYPLYFAIGAAILRATGGDPAHALNLA